MALEAVHVFEMALVVQWIELARPKGLIGVRFLSRAQIVVQSICNFCRMQYHAGHDNKGNNCRSVYQSFSG